MSGVLTFEEVSKRFKIQPERPRSFQEMLVRAFRMPPAEDFWALRNVSFAVAPGQTVGIVGSNGAGKSTVLKLAAGVLEPTSGVVRRKGRVAALLELGAGFHPDLSGRENVYLNGAFLGLTRRELDRKYDDIVRFADLERFMETPVKHYSSGMYLRLAFAVAIHLDADLLLVDEVLAVGDAAFQRKCLERIRRLQSDGVTILLVSHAPALVAQICNRAIWLDQGELRADGPPLDVLNEYTTRTRAAHAATMPAAEAAVGTSGRGRRWGTGEAVITAVSLLDASERPREVFGAGDPLIVRVHYRAERRIERPTFAVVVNHPTGINLSGFNSKYLGFSIPAIEGEGSVEVRIERLPFRQGEFFVSAMIYDEAVQVPFDHHDMAYRFVVIPRPGDRRASLLDTPATWVHHPAGILANAARERNGR